MGVNDSLIMKTFALWARAKGVKRPSTKEGMQFLFNEFLADQPNWAEIEGNYPLELGVNGATIDIQNDNGENPATDDFDEYVAERGRVLEEVGGDDLAREVVMQERRNKALNSEAPFVRSSPPSARKGVLGGVAAVSTDGVQQYNGQRAPTQATVAMWVSEDDSETTPVTVVLGVNQARFAATLATDPALKPFAIIKFGVRGSLEVEVDIGQGVQVVVAGSEVSVDVSLDPPIGSEAAGVMSLGGGLSFGAIERTTVPTRTRYVGNLNSGANSGVLSIPRFAVALNAIWRNDQSQTIKVDFQDANGNVVGTVTLAANTFLTQPVTIPPSAQFAVVTNTGGGAQPTSQIMFGLAL